MGGQLCQPLKTGRGVVCVREKETEQEIETTASLEEVWKDEGKITYYGLYWSDIAHKVLRR